MEKLLDAKPNLIKLPKIGDIAEGTIIGTGKSSVFIDLGNFGAGIIYGREFYEARETLKKIKIGDKIFAKIVDLENEQGYIELSLKEANSLLAWQNLQEKKEKQETITIRISKVNKGGLMAEVGGIPAFLPVSQLAQEHYPRVEGGDPTKILRELQKLINQELEVKILDLDQKEGKLILSEKVKDTEKIKELLKNYKVGDVIKGEITGIVGFGAFVRFPLPSEAQRAKEGSSAPPSLELPPPLFELRRTSRRANKAAEDKGSELLEGLIHISELDWQIIQNPADVVKIGDKVKAKIIDIRENKVFLSLKALKEDPWKEIEKKYKKGDVIKGTVTKFNPFGAFIQIDKKIQGLCHISEFGTQKRMEETLKIGETYDFQILLIDAKEHKMSLRLVSGK